MSYLKNTWYMLAWASELGEAPLSRTLLDTPIVLFRDPASQNLVALHDRCPHRFAPLSRGKVSDGRIACPYHGLEFNAQGQCVRNPAASVVPAAAKVRSFPVVAHEQAIWIWMGDPALADPARLPHVPHHARGDRMVTGYTRTLADYRLFCDNLMDLSHVTFLHPGIGGPSYQPKLRSWETENGDVVAEFLVARMANVYGLDVINSPEVRHIDTIRWMAPSAHYLLSQTGPADSDEVQVEVSASHILTPETATTSHYFWSSTAPGDMPFDLLSEGLHQAFDHEDKPMMEAVQERMGKADLFELDPVLLPNDVAAVRMRRRLTSLIAAESDTASATH